MSGSNLSQVKKERPGVVRALHERSTPPRQIGTRDLGSGRRAIGGSASVDLWR